MCNDVTVEVPKTILKQAAVQHLYGRLAARLKPGVHDGQLLQALHPTPAVCGRPREDALQYLQDSEQFDRGFYSGPFGWISGQSAEFVVAIRSALVTDGKVEAAAAGDQPPPPPLPRSHDVYLYAGAALCSFIQSICLSHTWQRGSIELN